MLGDAKDMQRRLRALLPARWFADQAPNLDGVLQSLATPWAWIYQFVQYVGQQARLATASDGWLDLIALDFLGHAIGRSLREPDVKFRRRIQYFLLRPAATRGAVFSAIEHLT